MNSMRSELAQEPEVIAGRPTAREWLFGLSMAGRALGELALEYARFRLQRRRPGGASPGR